MLKVPRVPTRWPANRPILLEGLGVFVNRDDEKGNPFCAVHRFLQKVISQASTCS
jgi:hypothetical protein